MAAGCSAKNFVKLAPRRCSPIWCVCCPRAFAQTPTAAYGIAVNRLDWRISSIGILAVLTFWVIDSYYLRQERLFRLLYDYVRSNIRAVPRFSMKTIRFNRRVHRRVVFFSLTLFTLYGMLIVVGVALTMITYSSSC